MELYKPLVWGCGMVVTTVAWWYGMVVLVSLDVPHVCVWAHGHAWLCTRRSQQPCAGQSLNGSAPCTCFVTRSDCMVVLVSSQLRVTCFPGCCMDERSCGCASHAHGTNSTGFADNVNQRPPVWVLGNSYVLHTVPKGKPGA